ncbi:MAG: RelA/SpoT family protein [Burkholderiales bacterium]
MQFNDSTANGSPAISSPPNDLLARARAFAQPLLAGQQLPTGEPTLAHADALAALLAELDGAPEMQAACYLVYAGEHLQRPLEVLTKAFDVALAALAYETLQLVRLQRHTRQHAGTKFSNKAQDMAQGAEQTETVRKMLLAFSRDLRVVMLYLASRLQTLRYFAAAKQIAPPEVAQECLLVLAPLANRLGIWQIKWELEDLAFRFLEPQTYRQIAALLDEKRGEREAYVEQLRSSLEQALQAQGLAVTVFGRPKHIYSIVKKMRGKSLGFEQVLDILGLRVVVGSVPACYSALAWVHAHFVPLEREFDDYIARPKANGYQSLHTVVREAPGSGHAGNEGRAIEIQIRTQAMHDHAEHGVAAHWAYKEAGIKGYAGVSASSAYDARIAVLRQLLAWQREMASGQLDGPLPHAPAQAPPDDRIYVLTPEASVVELPPGASPVDFAYAVHSSLGHRCRGARVDGVMVPLNTPLQNGQTVEVVVAKEGAQNAGPSRDWLNPELGYLTTGRAKSRVRAWFNALAAQETAARGREAVEKLLQRLGKTAIKLDDLATQLGFESADALFTVVGKDEFSLRTIETLFKPAEPTPLADELVLQKTARYADKAANGKSGVLVVGVDSLLTQLARCCKPAPPDAIGGFVTRGKGVSIHRLSCSNFRALQVRDEGRVIEVQWGQQSEAVGQYGVDVAVLAQDRQGLLRDISELFAKEKMNVTRVQTQSVKEQAFMTFTVQVSDTARLAQALAGVRQVPGVRSAMRR